MYKKLNIRQISEKDIFRRRSIRSSTGKRRRRRSLRRKSRTYDSDDDTDDDSRRRGKGGVGGAGVAEPVGVAAEGDAARAREAQVSRPSARHVRV